MYIWETKSAYGKEKWLIEFWREARSMGEDDLDVVTDFSLWTRKQYYAILKKTQDEGTVITME